MKMNNLKSFLLFVCCAMLSIQSFAAPTLEPSSSFLERNPMTGVTIDKHNHSGVLHKRSAKAVFKVIGGVLKCVWEIGMAFNGARSEYALAPEGSC
jgi:hypothetical protein